MVGAGSDGLRGAAGTTDAPPARVRGARAPDGAACRLDPALDPDPDPDPLAAYIDPVGWHMALHPGVLSHCSPNCVWTMPSPQYGAGEHAVVQTPTP